MTPDEIITTGDKLLEKMSTVNKRLYERVIDLIQLNVKDGRVSISDEQLAALEDVLYGEIKESDYEENLTKYLALFDAILNSIDKEQVKANKIQSGKVKDLWQRAENTTQFKEKVINDLGKNGVSKRLIPSIADMVREANYLNLDIKSAVEVLRTKLLGDGVDSNYVQRYVYNSALDVLSQYDGAIQEEVKKVYGFTKFKYIGNIIETSRPFCVHLEETLGGDITEAELKQALAEYCPGGQPSESTITYETVSGKRYTKKKGSGMIKGTTEGNFSELKGGYGCRHRVLWYK